MFIKPGVEQQQVAFSYLQYLPVVYNMIAHNNVPWFSFDVGFFKKNIFAKNSNLPFTHLFKLWIKNYEWEIIRKYVLKGKITQ